MTDLTREQRSALATTIAAARDEAELAAAEALRGLRVPEAEIPAGFDPDRRAQRNRLRAHARALDDKRAANGVQAITRLTEQAAYVQWHRLLFARFLIERGLLRDETGAPVSLTDCREIALDLSADEDEWSVASGFAAGMLPGVFPSDDPVESLRLTRERGRKLRNRLLSIEDAVFQADDSLGWTYQFWRAAEKERVNAAAKAGRKIGAAELPAVTQLFTEPYMVRFLLHNTLGAWWAGKVLAGNPALAREAANEAALRKACALPGYAWDSLRFVQEDGVWRPASGSFAGWPTTAKALTVLDPCCGSGHFLTEALPALTALRMAEESLSPANAVAAVLEENLAGLEIDGRCVQIAAFNLALTGWRIAGAGVPLPTPVVAWVGCVPPLPKVEFIGLANGDEELRRGLAALHDLFQQAPLLGSLIEPLGGDLIDPRRIARIEGRITTLVEKVRGAEPERLDGAIAALGMADAASILARRWSLQATNVPFLTRGKQNSIMANFISTNMPRSQQDLAVTMHERMFRLADKSGVVALVAPLNWIQNKNYEQFRNFFINNKTIIGITALGFKSFSYNNTWDINISLAISVNDEPTPDSSYFAIDVSSAQEKSLPLVECEIKKINQKKQNTNESKIIHLENSKDIPLLQSYASFKNGMQTGDYARFGRKFWELFEINNRWEYFQATVSRTVDIGGLDSVVLWEHGNGSMAKSEASVIRGTQAWGKLGVAVSAMGKLACAKYQGNLYDDNVVTIIPNDVANLPAIWAFCSSSEYAPLVRKADKALKVRAGLLRVPFDVSFWQGKAAELQPSALAEPFTDDPTQWLFHGHPRYASSGTQLHVVVARLAGYRWPAETDPTMRLSAEAHAHVAEAAALPAADTDGILPLAPLLGERSLADRLRAICIAVWGADWQPDTEAALVAAACDLAKDKRPAALTLDAWLRTHAARQHAKLFHDRPFLWWITDGRADGFCAIAHYHRLTKDKLERLAFQMLGDHLTRLGDDPRAEAGRILQRKLERIIEGEAPFDIFVRWKPPQEQPLGWDPDFDDGVRLNIRPFIEAGVLAHVPNVKYTVDRGKDVPSAPWYGMFNGERRNDHHTTLAEKREARAKAKA